MQLYFDAEYHRLAELRDQVIRRCSDLPVIPGDHVPSVSLSLETGYATATVDIKHDEAPENSSVIASLETSCITVLAQHRRNNIEKMLNFEAENLSVLRNRDEIIASQLATITDFQELLGLQHSMVNVTENQVTTKV